jgi:5'-3' exonuclease
MLEELSEGPAPPTWSTVAITPGTKFMDNLGKAVNSRFKNPKEFGLEELIVSSSAVPGEGEHKIYAYIRQNTEYHASTSTAIYGLDADLIMLTLNHLYIGSKMYLFRETPHFIKSIDKTLDPNMNYLMDIPELALVLGTDLNNGRVPTTTQQKGRIFDYILLCFLLGNDFMPHFPALNIRTSGIDRIMSAYKHVVSKQSVNLTDGSKIIWKNLRKVIQFLSEREDEYLEEEYQVRARQKKGLRRRKEDAEEELMSIPLKDTRVEDYISPSEKGWEERYYKKLFDFRIDDARRKEISINYLEGLEWNMNYYTKGCINWRWTYKYDYPPLLKDLIRFMPYFDTELVERGPADPVSPIVQLGYVLPQPHLRYLPTHAHQKLLQSHPEWYGTDYMFKWAFCKYFWESHIMMPHIDISKLEMCVK